MAVIAYSVTPNSTTGGFTIEWVDVTEADTCAPYSPRRSAQDITVGIGGTWGGATATIVGTVGPAAIPCTAEGGVVASWAANAMFSLRERPFSLTPTFTGGTGQVLTIALAVWL